MAYINAALAVSKLAGGVMQGGADRMNGNTQNMALDHEADQEQQAAMQQADIIRRARDYSVARATASYAASGVVVGEGSAEEVTTDIENRGTQDAYQTILNGQRKANALRAQGTIAAAGGNIAGAQADMQGVAGALGSGYQAYSGWVSRNPKTAGTAAGTGGEF